MHLNLTYTSLFRSMFRECKNLENTFMSLTSTVELGWQKQGIVFSTELHYLQSSEFILQTQHASTSY